MDFHQVQVNDVIVSVNNLDASSAPFDAVLEKLKIFDGELICIRFARPKIELPQSASI